MKILIVGGSGFCGSNFSKYYLDRGHSVTIFDNLSGIYSKHNLEWLNKQYNNLDIIVGDLKNFDILKKIIVNKDIVFHLAGQVSATKSIRDPREDFETNLLGTFNLLESIRIYNSSAVLMYISTNKVYGELKNFDFIFLFPQQLKYLNKSDEQDLIINTHSFMEMDYKEVDDYFNFINKTSESCLGELILNSSSASVYISFSNRHNCFSILLESSFR